MSILKKIGAPLAAVALTAAMGLSLLAGQGTAEAATVTTRGDNAAVTTGAAGSAVSIALTLTAAEMQNAQTLIVTLPAGFGWVAAPTGTLSGPATTLTGVGLGVLSSTGTAGSTATNDIATFTATANNNAAAVLTIAGNARYTGAAAAGGTNVIGSGSGSGSIALTGTGVAANTDIGTLQAAFVSPATITVTTSPAVASLAADGSATVSATATVSDVNGVRVSNRPVAWSVSLGVVSTGTSKTVTSFTSTNGVATTNYRGGGGVQATDTIIATMSSLNAVGTLAMPLVTATGTTASKLVINAPQQLAVAATVTNTSPGYISGQTGTNLSVKVTDSAGLGVNGQVVLITADKGFVMNGHNVACPGNTKAVSPTTATLAPTPGATAEAGIIQLTYCGNQLDAAGKATITAQNVTTSMANATQTISMAGRPSKVEATVTGNAITATVTDAAGNAVADGTPVRFTISANAGAVSTACTTSSNGKASSVVALIAASGTVIVSSDFNETGVAATCGAAGTQQVAASVVVGAGGSGSGSSGGSTGGSTGGATGAGGFASAPVYSASKLAQAVFNGGTVAQLETAVTAGMGTGVWAQDKNGVFVLYIVNGGFVNDAFKAAFPTGFSGVTAVTVVGK